MGILRQRTPVSLSISTQARGQPVGSRGTGASVCQAPEGEPGRFAAPAKRRSARTVST